MLAIQKRSRFEPGPPGPLFIATRLDSVIMLDEPSSTIILKDVIPDDAHSNTTRFETSKK